MKYRVMCLWTVLIWELLTTMNGNKDGKFRLCLLLGSNKRKGKQGLSVILQKINIFA